MKSNVLSEYCILLLFLAMASAASAQIDRSKTAYEIGYQVADFGHSLAASETQMMAMNAVVPDGGNTFSNGSQAFGLVLRGTFPGDKGVFLEFTLANKKVLSNQSYDYYTPDSSSFQPLDVFTKQRLRYFSFGAGYAWKRLSASASFDLGTFTSLIRYKGDAFDNKWQPWYYRPKIFGSGVSGKSPVIGATISLNYLLTRFLELRIHRQFTVFGMGAELSNRYFSLDNWGAELTFRFSSK
jgi:hypothetical protein